MINQKICNGTSFFMVLIFLGNESESSGNILVILNGEKWNMKNMVLRFFEGILIGLGAVLPGISGGVLCVVFGIYAPIMLLLSHPQQALRRYAGVLIPVILGAAAGFLGVSKLLGYLLSAYPNPSVCVFVGLIIGMLPTLFREAGRNKQTESGVKRTEMLSLILCFFGMLFLLLGLSQLSVSITPSYPWYVFCGFCMALSVIAPGMSFSTLLMPLGLYTPLVTGIGNLDVHVLFPAGIGAVLTVILLANAITILMERYYGVVFHGIIGIVIAATLVIIPFQSFTESVSASLINLMCMAAGIVVAFLLDRMNRCAE